MRGIIQYRQTLTSVLQPATSASPPSPSRCTYDMFIVQIWKEKVIFRNVDLWPSSQSRWDLNSIFNRCTHGINLKVLHCLILELSYWQTCVSTPPARPPGWQQRSQPPGRTPVTIKSVFSTWSEILPIILQIRSTSAWWLLFNLSPSF